MPLTSALPAATGTSDALRQAFQETSISVGKTLTPKDLLEFDKADRNSEFARIFSTPAFWRPWGYVSRTEGEQLFKLESVDGVSLSADEKVLLEPLAKWARAGKIDKKNSLSCVTIQLSVSFYLQKGMGAASLAKFFGDL
jgi:hypothetical protein